MIRRLALAALLLALVSLPAEAPGRSAYDDCGYDESTVDTLTDAQIEDLSDCLDRFGWTYDEN